MHKLRFICNKDGHRCRSPSNVWPIARIKWWQHVWRLIKWCYWKSDPRSDTAVVWLLSVHVDDEDVYKQKMNVLLLQFSTIPFFYHHRLIDQTSCIFDYVSAGNMDFTRTTVMLTCIHINTHNNGCYEDSQVCWAVIQIKCAWCQEIIKLHFIYFFTRLPKKTPTHLLLYIYLFEISLLQLWCHFSQQLWIILMYPEDSSHVTSPCCKMLDIPWSHTQGSIHKAHAWENILLTNRYMLWFGLLVNNSNEVWSGGGDLLPLQWQLKKEFYRINPWIIMFFVHL